MQWLANISVRRPVFASVIILSLTVVGLFSYGQLGLDQFPKVDFPTVIVTTRLPGASPEQIETEVSDKLEESINTISGIDDLRSVSSEGISQVIVQFVLEKDVNIAAQEVRDKVNRAIPDLPKTVDQPTVEKMDPDASPVLTLAVTSDKPVREVTEFADKVLRRRLESITGVGQVLVLGGRERQINLWLDAARLHAYHITVNDVSRALQQQNAEIPGGRIEEGPRTLTLRTLGRVPSVNVFNDVVVKDINGHQILLRDVARVDDGMADATSLVNVNGVSTVVLQIRRQSGTNTVEVVNAVKERLDDLRPTLPKGYDVRIVRDMSTFIKASIHSVTEHLIIGSILAALVVLIFLWNLRSTMIAAIAIPTSIVSTFGLMWYMGFTLNMMTMLGLTLAVGIVIDDAIVVLENIYRFIEEKGMRPFEAAIEATKEIGLAVLATTLSLVAIFIPVGFMGGIVGRFMKSFGLTMAFAILVSLVVSFTLTPMMSSRWLKAIVRRTDEQNDGEAKPAAEGHGTKDSGFFAPIDRWYTRLMHWSLRHRGLVAGVTVAVFMATVPLFMIVSKTFLPQDDQSEFEVSVRAPEGTSLEGTELLTTRIATRVRELAPEIAYTLVTAGADAASTPNVSTVYVRLKDVEQRKRDQFVIMKSVRDTLAKEYAGQHLRMAVQPVATFGGGGNQNADIQFLINGPDLNKLADMGNAIAAEVRKMPNVVDVDTSMNVGKPEVSVQVDRLKAGDLGVQIADAADALRLLVGGDEVTNYNEGGEQYEVHLRAEQGDRTTKAAIANLTVPSSKVGIVSLDNVSTFSDTQAPAEVNRLARQRQVTVYANVLPGASQSEAIAAIQQKFAAVNSDPAYAGQFVGRSRELGRAASNFLIAFFLSLVFMYLILAAQFESWIHPITILLSLPLTLPFALFALIVTGQSLNIFSALGLLVLFGVVKKNSILQIDHAIQLREHGMDKEAAIIQASRDRLRPILMTTLAFVAGMIPLVISSGTGAGTNRAIGFVVIGGQSLALLLTLVATPVAYSLFDSAANFRLLSRVWNFFTTRRTAATTATTAGVLLLAAALSTQVASAQTPTAQPASAQAATAGPAPRISFTQAPAGQPSAAQVPASQTAAPQTGAPSAAPAQPEAAAGPSKPLSLQQAVEMALSNNPDLAVARVEPKVGAAEVGQARGAFLPYLTGSAGHSSSLSPPTSFLVSSGGTQTTDWFSTVGVRQRLPFGGGTWNVSWDNTRETTNSILTNFSPENTAGLTVAFSQPLLRDLSIDAARQQLIVSKRNQQISDLNFKEAVVQTMSQVKRAYWDLVAANANVTVQQQSLDLSLELVRMNKARVDVGQSPPLDLVSAQAESEQRREQLILARQTAREAEDTLRALIMQPGSTDFWATHLQPTDTPPVGGPTADVDAAVKAALATRSDVERARLDLANAGTSVKYLNNQRLPDVRLELSHRGAGLGGTQFIRQGTFPGTIVGQQNIPYSTVLDQIFSRDFPTWSAGVTVSVPLGHGYEDASLARAKLQEQQAKARLDSLQTRTVKDIRQAAWQVDTTAQRVETTRVGRDLAEQRLDAEQKRYEVGMSTSFLVVQAQRDLAQARVNELSAMLDHQVALVDFESLQQAPSANSGNSVSIAGANIVALPPPTPRGISAPSSGSIF
jgi:HAE1 family hydrophobic/amphiphilic exporter-1